MTDTTIIVAAITQIVTFLGVVVGLVFSYLREGRAERWRREEQERLERAREHQDDQHKVLHEEVLATKEAAGAAYTEANHLNEKIEQAHLDHVKTEEALKEAVEIGVQAALMKRDRQAGHSSGS